MPRHRSSRALPPLVALLIGACAGGPTGPVPAASPSIAAASRSPAATSRATPTTSPSPATSPSVSLAPVASEQPLFAFKGDERRLRLYRPDPMPSGTVPLVIFLHALGETPLTAVRDTGLDRLAATPGAIVIFPPAAARAWAAGVTPGLSDDPVDLRWLTALIDHLLTTEPIDPQRVFVAGFSMGAVMTDKLACQLSDRVAAAVVVAGTPWAGGTCAAKQPVSMLIIHGTADPTFPYAGAEQLATQWRKLDRCTGVAPAMTVGSGAMRVAATGCADHTSVDFVTVQDGVHMWFSDPDATSLAWEFLSGHARS